MVSPGVISEAIQVLSTEATPRASVQVSEVADCLRRATGPGVDPGQSCADHFPPSNRSMAGLWRSAQSVTSPFSPSS